jgi:thiamine pyrophosphokinase
VVALILADGDIPTLADLQRHWPWWSDGVGVVVAADGGARHAGALGVTIDVWVGDGDSTDHDDLAALAAAGVEIERSSTDKDETDTELAILAALARDPAGVVVLGATGGPRIDHELANIALLAMPELAGRVAVLVTTGSTIRLLRGTGDGPRATLARLSVQGEPGDTASLIPFGGDAVGVTTWGLRYPLDDATLPLGTPRGISNVIEDEGGQVAVREGLLLIVETPATIVG